MKKTDKKIEDFWDGLTVRKTDQDKELQRKVVLGADAIVRTIFKGILRGIVIAILIFIVLYAIQQIHTPSRGLHNGRIVADHSENGHFVEDRPTANK